MNITAKEIAQIINGQVDGDQDVSVTQPAPIDQAQKGTIAFYAHPKYEQFVYSTKASIVLVPNDFVPEKPISRTLIRVPDVRQALSILYRQFGQPTLDLGTISPNATIAESAIIGEQTSVGAFTTIGRNVKIGQSCRIYPQVFIDDEVEIGDHVTLFPGVRIMANSILDNNIIIHANAVIGSDGFGFAPDESGKYQKIQQLGNVHIQSDVEIGANVCIDRAALGSTVIEEGVKLDNLIHVAHNVRIGANTVIAAQAGIAGSTEIGQGSKIGGQVGIVGHIRIGDRNEIQAQSGVTRSTEPGTRLFGYPAFNYNGYLRSYAAFKNLPSLLNEIRALQKEVDCLKGNTSK